MEDPVARQVPRRSTRPRPGPGRPSPCSSTLRFLPWLLSSLPHPSFSPCTRYRSSPATPPASRRSSVAGALPPVATSIRDAMDARPAGASSVPLPRCSRPLLRRAPRAAVFLLQGQLHRAEEHPRAAGAVSALIRQRTVPRRPPPPRSSHLRRLLAGSRRPRRQNLPDTVFCIAVNLPLFLLRVI